MLSGDLRKLTKSAIERARQCVADEDHTVVAALRTRTGATVFGLNTYHFLGGPCGEISALSNHAFDRPDDPVVAVVAVRSPAGEVIPPCGKCRQVLYDLDPAIQCVVRGPNGLEAVAVDGLLPFAFDWRAADNPPQLIYMWDGYQQSIRDRRKRQTIRVDDPFHVGPAVLVFDKPSGDRVTLDADVTDVRTMPRTELTDEIARADGFGDLAELHRALDRHYPGLADDDDVDVVSFTLR